VSSAAHLGRRLLSQVEPAPTEPPEIPAESASDGALPHPLRRWLSRLLAIGVVLIGLTVALVLVFAVAGGGETRLTTADLTPASAGLYVALNTDLASDQWIRAFALAQRLGANDPERDLRAEVEEGADLNWQRDVAPFLGGDAAFYLRAIDFDDGAPTIRGAVIVRAADPDRALAVIEAEADLPFRDRSYLDIAIRFHEGEADDTVFLARLGDHVVVAPDQGSMFDVIDVFRGRSPSLSSLAAFGTLREQMPDRFLSLLYVDPSKLGGDALYLNDADVRDAVEGAKLDELLFEPTMGAIRAQDGGFVVEAVSGVVDGGASAFLRPRSSRFAGLVPDGTMLFVSTAFLAGTWSELRADVGDEIDEALAEQGEYESLDAALADAGRQLGLDSLTEVIDLATGEVALALWFPDSELTRPEVAFLIEVEREVEACAILQRATAALEIRISEPGVPRVTTLGDESEVAYAIQDGYVVIGTFDAVLDIVADDRRRLTQDAHYAAAVAGIDTPLGSFVYLNLGSLLAIAAEDLPGEFGKLEDVLQSLILNAVQDSGVNRLTGVLAVAE